MWSLTKTEQMLKMKPQHGKVGKHVMYSMYGTCEWDRIVRIVVQCVLWCHNSMEEPGLLDDDDDNNYGSNYDNYEG